MEIDALDEFDADALEEPAQRCVAGEFPLGDEHEGAGQRGTQEQPVGEARVVGDDHARG